MKKELKGKTADEDYFIKKSIDELEQCMNLPERYFDVIEYKDGAGRKGALLTIRYMLNDKYKCLVIDDVATLMPILRKYTHVSAASITDSGIKFYKDSTEAKKSDFYIYPEHAVSICAQYEFEVAFRTMGNPMGKLVSMFDDRVRQKYANY